MIVQSNCTKTGDVAELESESNASQADDGLHVVTEDGNRCVLWRANELTYIAQHTDNAELPQVIALKFGPLATKLDISYNAFSSFKNIQMFTRITELILDNNLIDDQQIEQLRLACKLRILSINKNRLQDLSRVIAVLRRCHSDLEYLSLIGNPLCPTPLIYANIEDNDTERSAGHLESVVGAHNARTSYEISHRKYRHFIIGNMSKLRFLDSCRVDEEEREVALRKSKRMQLSVGDPRAIELETRGHRPDEPMLNKETFDSNSVLRPYDRWQASTTATELSDFRQATTSEPTELSIMSDDDSSRTYDDTHQLRQQILSKGTFLRLSHKYTGKNSEGNRFIRNNDL